MISEKKKYTDLLSMLEGYHQCLKMLHWQTTNKAEHLLTDDIDGRILEYEDKIAESIMGYFDQRIGVGDLKSLLPTAKTLIDVLKELQQDIEKFEVDQNNRGLNNILDDFLEDINKWKYLARLK